MLCICVLFSIQISWILLSSHKIFLCSEASLACISCMLAEWAKCTKKIMATQSKNALTQIAHIPSLPATLRSFLSLSYICHDRRGLVLLRNKLLTMLQSFQFALVAVVAALLFILILILRLFTTLFFVNTELALLPLLSPLLLHSKWSAVMLLPPLEAR